MPTWRQECSNGSVITASPKHVKVLAVLPARTTQKAHSCHSKQQFCHISPAVGGQRCTGITATCAWHTRDAGQDGEDEVALQRPGHRAALAPPPDAVAPRALTAKLLDHLAQGATGLGKASLQSLPSAMTSALQGPLLLRWISVTVPGTDVTSGGIDCGYCGKTTSTFRAQPCAGNVAGKMGSMHICNRCEGRHTRDLADGYLNRQERPLRGLHILR